MYGNLSLQQAPPFSVPARFFISAPLFGIVAALILLFTGPDLLESRWTPALLAVTHALVLGFFATVMIGALQQILPVVAGVTIPHPRRLATLVHTLWVPGVALLIAAFLNPLNSLFYAALLMIAGAIIIFVGALFLSLKRSPSNSESLPGIKLAASSLLITLLMGIVLVFGYTGLIPLWRPGLTNLHLSWGVIGWITVLIISISWQVVPMFQITPPYPSWLRRGAVPTALSLLLAKSLLTWPTVASSSTMIATAIDLLIALGLLAFAITTLQLQAKTRRRIKDAHRNFWRLAMVNLIMVVVFWFVAEITDKSLFYLLTGATFLMGFAMAVVTGMLLKIIAFLIWLHLQGVREQLIMQGKPIITVPKMKGIISTRQSNGLLLLLIASQLMLITALPAPQWFTIPAALLWLVYFCTLTGVIGYALFRYHRFIRRVDPLNPAP